MLEDTNGDGRADRITHMLDTMNIPIGILPVADGVVTYSIPYVYRYTDSDNDGTLDRRDKLLGPFGFDDTHGMVNNFIRGFDGWIHSSHGFTNFSTVAGSDGDSISMTSGNTFRFLPDGSRAEQTTFGRVNPFGFSYDEWGYLYSIDCHSKPIYQLIFDGEYPHFGKKAPPGIGFAPEMTSYELGSTALSGLVFYTGSQFPEEYRNSFFSGDVVTCQINRNSVEFQGATPIAKREEDFLVSKDPWFRPVDMKVGPDGSLYVADFYNRIIGHYEVPLDHPGRDQRSGRIWKITYTGGEKHNQRNGPEAGPEELISELNHSDLNFRFVAANQLVDVWQEKAVSPVRKLLADDISDRVYVQALWILDRLNSLYDTELLQALNHESPLVRVHALRILGEKATLNHEWKQRVREFLDDDNPHVKRLSAEVLGRFPEAEDIRSLLHLYQSTEEIDDHLRYTVLLSIRNILRVENEFRKFSRQNWSEEDLMILARIALDVPHQSGAEFVLDFIQKHEVASQDIQSSLEYVARFLPATRIDEVVHLIRDRYGNDTDHQLVLYRITEQGMSQKGTKPSAAFRSLGTDLAKYYLSGLSEDQDVWKSRPLYPSEKYSDPWMVSDAFLTDVASPFRIILSEANRYRPTSILYSVPFRLPAELSMNIFDNDIHNTEEKTGVSRNSVRIRLQESGEIISRYRMEKKKSMEFAELIDQDVVFDLKRWEGQWGYIEVVDSTRSGSVGIGNLKPDVAPIPEKGTRAVTDQRITAVKIAENLRIFSLQPVLEEILGSSQMNDELRTSAAVALMRMDPAKNMGALDAALEKENNTPLFSEKIIEILGQFPSEPAYKVLQNQLEGSSLPLQKIISYALSGTERGIDYLLDAQESGLLYSSVWAEKDVKSNFESYSSDQQRERWLGLVGKDMDFDAEKDRLIESRLAGWAEADPKPEPGKLIYQQQCGICHQIKGEGGLIGPQLDGIGNWGTGALTEKILDPNRNISPAFKTYDIVMKNGSRKRGLYRRSEGAAEVFADQNGEEFYIPKDDIQEKVPSSLTLMPDHFGEVMSEAEFYDLMSYLMQVK